MVHRNFFGGRMSTKNSESVEMYVKQISVLQTSNGKPVPLSVLAANLSILPTSANEMCRRLAAEELVEYRPYKGVNLTPAGESLAQRVLCRQHIWESFLVETLNFDLDEAEETACQLEHATSDALVRRLAEFLDFPTVSPRGMPIPCVYGSPVEPVVMPLSSLDAGQTAYVNKITGDEVVREILQSQGLTPGTKVSVLSIKVGESMLLEVSGSYLSLAQPAANAVNVALNEAKQPAPDKLSTQVAASLDQNPEKTKEITIMQQVSQITLDQLPVGKQGIIVQIEGSKAAKRRMLDMGMVTGETVTLKAIAPMGDPLEFVVKDYQLSLRKSDARRVTIELIDEGVTKQQ
jgi:DtxR family transcriptional regulator, Mn-dependent transcriptional regulator